MFEGDIPRHSGPQNHRGKRFHTKSQRHKDDTANGLPALCGTPPCQTRIIACKEIRSPLNIVIMSISPRRLAPLFAILLIGWTSTLHGLELGFYFLFPEEGKRDARMISELTKQADRWVWCYSTDKFDVGLETPGPGRRTRISVNFAQARPILEKENPKDFIVAQFDKLIMRNERTVIDDAVRDVTEKLLKVGYKRVVILGANAQGVYYLADTELISKEQK